MNHPFASVRWFAVIRIVPASHALPHYCKLPQLVKLSNIAPQVVTLHCLSPSWPHQRRPTFYILPEWVIYGLIIRQRAAPSNQECGLWLVNCLNVNMWRYHPPLAMISRSFRLLLSIHFQLFLNTSSVSGNYQKDWKRCMENRLRIEVCEFFIHFCPQSLNLCLSISVFILLYSDLFRDFNTSTNQNRNHKH